MNIDEQRIFVKDKLKELREIVINMNVVDEVHFDRLYDLLTDSMCDVRMKPFKFTRVISYLRILSPRMLGIITTTK